MRRTYEYSERVESGSPETLWNTTRRGVADDLGVPAVEAIAVTQAIERIIAVVRDHDPTLDGVTFDVDVHDRATEQAPYQRSDE